MLQDLIQNTPSAEPRKDLKYKLNKYLSFFKGIQVILLKKHGFDGVKYTRLQKLFEMFAVFTSGARTVKMFYFARLR